MVIWDRVRALCEEVGNENVAEIVALFFEEVERVVARLPCVQDAKSLAEDTHFLKSGALNLGFGAFSDLCSAAEKTAQDGHWRDVNIPAMMECYKASKALFLRDIHKETGVQISL